MNLITTSAFRSVSKSYPLQPIRERERFHASVGSKAWKKFVDTNFSNLDINRRMHRAYDSRLVDIAHLLKRQGDNGYDRAIDATISLMALMLTERELRQRHLNNFENGAHLLPQSCLAIPAKSESHLPDFLIVKSLFSSTSPELVVLGEVQTHTGWHLKRARERFNHRERQLWQPGSPVHLNILLEKPLAVRFAPNFKRMIFHLCEEDIHPHQPKANRKDYHYYRLPVSYVSLEDRSQNILNELVPC